MANMKAMESDWFAQTYMGRKSKVKIAAGQLLAFSQIHTKHVDETLVWWFDITPFILHSQ